MSNTASDTSSPQEMAEEADRRAMEALTQDDRETWQRISAYWWDRVPSMFAEAE